MIKGKPSYPFQTIALAVAFNNELSFLVSEMRKLASSHASMSVFIHCGKKTNEKFRELSTILSANGFHDGNSRIYWEQGQTIPSILQICKHEVVDLLLIGLSQRNAFALPVGSVTANLSQKAKCSLLIYSTNKDQIEKIVVDAADHRKTNHALLTALYFGERIHAKELIVLDRENSYSQISVSQPSVEQEEETGTVLTHALERSGMEYSILQKEQLQNVDSVELINEKDADLFVINSVDHHLKIFERITIDHIGEVLGKINCNILIVHSRLKEEGE